jgi:hypothetical protein
VCVCVCVCVCEREERERERERERKENSHVPLWWFVVWIVAFKFHLLVISFNAFVDTSSFADVILAASSSFSVWSDSEILS